MALRDGPIHRAERSGSIGICFLRETCRGHEMRRENARGIAVEFHSRKFRHEIRGGLPVCFHQVAGRFRSGPSVDQLFRCRTVHRENGGGRVRRYDGRSAENLRRDVGNVRQDKYSTVSAEAAENFLLTGNHGDELLHGESLSGHEKHQKGTEFSAGKIWKVG